MVPAPWLEVLCCPACRSDLVENEPDLLSCSQCQASYPVISGIPVLLTGPEDEVSRAIHAFYDDAWKRDQQGVTHAKRAHEDTSPLGQRYIELNEHRFEERFAVGGRYFLDAACGAQPRERFGETFDYHVCVDFSLDGLVEAWRVLGSRAVCAVGSLLDLPVKDGTCTGVLAAHSIYHVDADTQQRALDELARVSSDTVLVLYSNPDAWERRLARLVRRLRRRPTVEDPWRGSFYFYAHPIGTMRDMLRSAFGEKAAISAWPLRMFSVSISAPLFRLPLIGPLALRVLALVDKRLRTPRPARYVAYEVRRTPDRVPTLDVESGHPVI